MAVKEILLLGNPALREKSAEISSVDEKTKKVISNLHDTLLDFQKRQNTGRAIAAPQIGELVRIICVNIPGRKFALINPKIIVASDEKMMVWDSCFSFDVRFYVYVERFKGIKVEYLNELGESVIEKFEGDMSELLQHEIDHLDGIMATDLLKDPTGIILREEWEKRYKG